MTRTIASLFMAACALAAAPCTADDVDTAIAAQTAAWAKAFNAGDAAGTAAIYTRDGMLLPPNEPSITGRAAIEEFWSGAMGDGFTAALESHELEPAGDDLAYEIGAYTVSDDAGETVDAGKYLVIWRREGDGWYMHRDMYSSDKAAEPAPPAE